MPGSGKVTLRIIHEIIGWVMSGCVLVAFSVFIFDFFLKVELPGIAGPVYDSAFGIWLFLAIPNFAVCVWRMPPKHDVAMMLFNCNTLALLGFCIIAALLWRT